MKNIKPFLRWAGGKQWLTKTLLSISPEKYSTYYEPFLGGASFFLTLGPKNAVLGDLNKQLIYTYMAIKNFPEKVIAHLRKWANNKETYYQIRSSEFNEDSEKAAQFIYLNKTCWNGLYRVNTRGLFNVPFSDNGRRVFEVDQIISISDKLQNAKLIVGDFEFVLKSAKTNDLIYLDPPYTVSHSNNGFRQYNEKLFSWDDQIRLARIADFLIEKGCYVIVSNAMHKPLIDLYSNFKILEISRQSIIAANSKHRKKITEILLISPNII